MLYLIRKTKRSKAHIWNGRDTYCTMYSTGGLNKKKYEVVGETYKQPTCTMCMNIFNKLEGKHERHRVHTTAGFAGIPPFFNWPSHAGLCNMGEVMTGYQSKKAAAQDKLDEDDDTQVYKDHDDLALIAYQSGYYDGKKAALAGRERNFCPRCGKRTADLTVIHTCTPPQENT